MLRMKKIKYLSLFLLGFSLLQGCTPYKANEEQKKQRAHEKVKEVVQEIADTYLDEYTTKDGALYTVVYDTREKTPIVKIHSKELDGPIRLEQVEAWSKGAVYGKGDIKFTASGSKATLDYKGKKVKLNIKNNK